MNMSIESFIRFFTLATLLAALSACSAESKQGSNLAEGQKQALERAKGVEQMLKDNAAAQEERIREQLR